MKTFLKGLCIGLLCLSLLGLAWFLVLQPGLTNGEAQALLSLKIKTFNMAINITMSNLITKAMLVEDLFLHNVARLCLCE